MKVLIRTVEIRLGFHSKLVHPRQPKTILVIEALISTSCASALESRWFLLTSPQTKSTMIPLESANTWQRSHTLDESWEHWNMTLCKTSSLPQPKLSALFNTITSLLRFWKLVTCACSKTILPEEGKKCIWPEHQLQNQHSYFFHALWQLPKMLRVQQQAGRMKAKLLHKETGQTLQLQPLHASSLDELPWHSCDQTAAEHNREKCFNYEYFWLAQNSFTSYSAAFLFFPKTQWFVIKEK